MILRRIKSRVAKEDWFAVFIDFFIVVVGVMMAIQVSNLNDARQEDRQAAQAIEDLHADFIVIDESAMALANYYKDVVEDLETLMKNLRAGEINPNDENVIKDAIAYGDVFGDPPPPSGTFRDLVSSGNLSLIRDRNLRLKLIEYDQSLTAITESDANINSLLGHFAYAFKKYAIMESNFEFPDAKDLAFVDVGLPSVSSVNYEMILTDPDFRVAAEQHLRLQIGRYINARVSQSKIAQVQNLLALNLDTPEDFERKTK